MKENSIEEDIKILEEKMNKELDFLIENANKTEQLTAISIIAMKEPIILLFLSILSDYKRILKENKEKNNRINQLENMNKFQSKDIKEAVDYTFELNKEIEFRDKQIDLMAEMISIYDLDIPTLQKQQKEKYCEFIRSDEDCCWKTDKTCADCIKHYFENKAKEK